MNLGGNENEMTVANNYVTAEQIAVHRWSPITELPAIFFAKVGAAVMLNRKRLCRFPFLLDNNTMAYSLSSTKWDADFAKALFGTVDLTSLVQVGALPSYNAGDVESMEIYLPSLLEQEQIGGFFKQLDNLITLHQRQPFLHSPPDISLIVQLTPSFYTFSWEQRKLEDYLTVSAEKNTGNIYGRSDVLSVSGDYGIVNQIEFQGRSFAGASVSNYGVVQTGDVVYTKSPLNSNPYGIIKTNKGKPGIVSTLYAVYHPKENAFSDFIQVYFEQHARMNNYMHPLVNKGAKNDMKVSAENALKGPVCFPSRIEQESISAFFSVLDNLITLHQRQAIVYGVIRSIRKVILAERQYFAPPMVRKSP